MSQKQYTCLLAWGNKSDLLLCWNMERPSLPSKPPRSEFAEHYGNYAAGRCGLEDVAHFPTSVQSRTVIISLGEAGPQNVHLLSPEERLPAEAKPQISAGRRLGAYFFQPTPLQEQRHCPQHDRLRSFEEWLPLLQLPIGWGPPTGRCKHSRPGPITWRLLIKHGVEPRVPSAPPSLIWNSSSVVYLPGIWRL